MYVDEKGEIKFNLGLKYCRVLKTYSIYTNSLTLSESLPHRLKFLVTFKDRQTSQILKSLKLHLPHLLFWFIFGIWGGGNLTISDTLLWLIWYTSSELCGGGR